jgi:hypothetical protein
MTRPKRVFARGVRHGHSLSPTWRSWSGMLTRCLNERVPNYRWYGGRGIEVCERWLTFLNFLEDMGERPEGMTLDRIDPNGNYEPENCRWSTVAAQNANRTNNIAITVGGITKTVDEWARESGVSAFTIYGRLRRGWPQERAVQPKDFRRASE